MNVINCIYLKLVKYMFEDEYVMVIMVVCADCLGMIIQVLTKGGPRCCGSILDSINGQQVVEKA